MILSKWIKKQVPLACKDTPCHGQKQDFLKKNDCPKEGAGEGTQQRFPIIKCPKKNVIKNG
jgi:hypothetical protein